MLSMKEVRLEHETDQKDFLSWFFQLCWPTQCQRLFSLFHGQHHPQLGYIWCTVGTVDIPAAETGHWDYWEFRCTVCQWNHPISHEEVIISWNMDFAFTRNIYSDKPLLTHLVLVLVHLKTESIIEFHSEMSRLWNHNTIIVYIWLPNDS